ncbi:hypothetical protein K458DRAFT_429233 [Lentithecium fluviatile CBS 122367]|uniref:Uncharacterized protein n=1 Tax=Lentithecium fluviatile CBS 122367 TaxID=1168545 RepID=A0A6G1J9P7_9PLEO|nr:hypothetical protein K458DRAFT_429233 [Lentithecium fluviatile CBS 122367]
MSRVELRGALEVALMEMDKGVATGTTLTERPRTRCQFVRIRATGKRRPPAAVLEPEKRVKTEVTDNREHRSRYTTMADEDPEDDDEDFLVKTELEEEHYHLPPRSGRLLGVFIPQKPTIDSPVCSHEDKESQKKAHTKAQSKAKTKKQTKAQTETQTKMQTRAKTRSQTKAGTKARMIAQTVKLLSVQQRRLVSKVIDKGTFFYDPPAGRKGEGVWRADRPAPGVILDLQQRFEITLAKNDLASMWRKVTKKPNRLQAHYNDKAGCVITWMRWERIHQRKPT